MKSHRGFAMIVALVVLALVTALLASLTQTCATAFQRDAEAAADTQLRQLLLAGAAIAPANLQSAISQSLPLPQSLTAQNATLTLTVTHPTPTDADATVEAALPPRRLTEHLHYTRTQTNWLLTRAELNPDKKS